MIADLLDIACGGPHHHAQADLRRPASSARKNAGAI
jgi:hypothetical protein